MGFLGELPARFLGELPAGFLDELPAGFLDELPAGFSSKFVASIFLVLGIYFREVTILGKFLI